MNLVVACLIRSLPYIGLMYFLVYVLDVGRWRSVAIGCTMIFAVGIFDAIGNSIEEPCRNR
jgi:hypothetical protein